MTGMITTGSTNLSNYSARTLSLEVTGVCRQDVSRTSSYTIKVPYNRLSQTMQSIQRMGGKVNQVNLLAVGAPKVTQTVAAREKENPKQEEATKKGGKKK
jgi:phycocyanin-associated, rod